MGCDIHAMIERRERSKRGDPLWWVNAGDPCLNRTYNVFAALAGVRRGIEINPVALPRGIPCDGNDSASEPMREWHKAWEGDAHSASYLSLEEIKAYRTPEITPDEWTAGDAETWAGLIRDMENAKRPGDADDDVRLVFFFDN